MADHCIKNEPEAQLLVEVLDPATPRINLSSADDVRREMAKVYREARCGKLAIGDATKLSYILIQVLKAYEMVALEGRLEVLERGS